MRKLIEICGNCKTYRYDDPASEGGCLKTRGKLLSPLAPVCNDYEPKKR